MKANISQPDHLLQREYDPGTPASMTTGLERPQWAGDANRANLGHLLEFALARAQKGALTPKLLKDEGQLQVGGPLVLRHSHTTNMSTSVPKPHLYEWCLGSSHPQE